MESTDEQAVNGPEETEEGNDGNAPAPDEHKKAEDAAEAEKEKPAKRRKLFIFGGLAILILAVGGLAYWLYARQFESTDDAFIEGDITQVSPKVSAYVTRVAVEGNQFVHKGDLLVELSPDDLQVKLEQAKAQVQGAQSQYRQALANAHLTRSSVGATQTQARANVQTTQSNVEQIRKAADATQSQISQANAVLKTAQANLAQLQAQVAQPEADVKLAQVEYDRRKNLFDRGDISRQSLDQAVNALQNARSRVESARRQVDAARSRVDEARAGVNTATENYRQSLAQINVGQSQVGESRGRLEEANTAPERIEVSQSEIETAKSAIASAEVAVHEAELQLSYTKIYAPEDGFITRKTVQEGQLVQIGAPLMAISQSDSVWVVANFKETQLELMQPGQAVDIKVDAFPNETFRGRIESFQAGTGSRFSLLPAENATGNFVKVVQRLPVKIIFDEPGDRLKRLFPGMSAEPVVKVR